MKLALISDYPFVRCEDGRWYSSVPWDKRFLATFGPSVERIVLVGRCRHGNAADVKDMHPVDPSCYDVHPTVDWDGWRFVARLPRLLGSLRRVLERCDGVILKMFYVQSILAFWVNRLTVKRPSAALLVGDAAAAITLRADLIPIRRLRDLASTLVFHVTRHILERVDVAATVSDQLRRKYTTRPDVVVANESWIEESHFYTRPREQSPGRTVLSVGRLVPLKGLADLAAALGRLHKEGFDFRWVIVGDGPQRQALEARVAELGFADRVEFTGWLRPLSEELFRTYRQADVLCLPSYAEGLPLVLIEAMANSVPVVASRVNGVPELVRHEETGLLIDPGDVEGLAASIKRLLTDEALRARCIEGGIRCARENTYSVQRGRFGRAVVERFASLAGGAAGRAAS